jgi:hypothetical protein
MKIGAEEKTKLKFMIGLVAVAVLIIGYNLLSSPSTPRPNPSQTSSTNTGQPKKAGETSSSLDPTVRFDILRTSQSVVYGGGGRNIFRMEAANFPIPQMQGPARVQGPPPPHPGPIDVPPKPIPAITLRFYGFANKPGEPKRIFLSDNGETFLAREGDIVERRYKIVQINNQANSASVVVEDVLNNTRQTIPLTASPN